MERFVIPQPGSSGGTRIDENPRENQEENTSHPSFASIEISDSSSDSEAILEELPVQVVVEVHNDEVFNMMEVPIQSSEQKSSDDTETNQRDTEPVNPAKKKKFNITPKTTIEHEEILRVLVKRILNCWWR